MKTIWTAVLAMALSGPGLPAAEPYEGDVAFALEALPKACGKFIAAKKIDWGAVSAQFKKEAREVSTDQEHLVLLVRLVARLQDGHASVRPLAKGKDVRWPDEPKRTGAGMFWCEFDGKLYVKNSWASAAQAGVKPGMQVVKVDGEDAGEWLEARIATLADKIGFSTPQQARFYACHWGLVEEVGKEMKLELRDGARRRKADVTFARATQVPNGPAFLPKPKGEFRRVGDLTYAVLESGFGYVHVRRCKGELPGHMDEALEALGPVPGIILDFRGNSGGGFDHEAFMGRFIPAGKAMRFAKAYESAGTHPYGGPIVVIVDATVRSAGETGAAIFKEDGRAYLIGESPTAGMSSAKKVIDLPSGLFGLYVSVASNMARSNDGRGLEGVGTIPHETVAFDPGDLEEQRDTLILRAEKLLQKFPQREVPYDPKKFGWKAE